MTDLDEVEAELIVPLPRPVRRRAGAGRTLIFGRLFILPHVLAGLGILGFAVFRTVLFLAVMLAGIETTGKVTAKSTRVHKSQFLHYVDYSYIVAGEMYEDRVKIDGDVFTRIEEGQEIAVRAVPWSPRHGHWPRIVSHEPFVVPVVAWLCAAFWNLCCSIAVWHMYIKPWRHRHLLRWGTPVLGVVESIEGSGSRRDVAYAYQPVSAGSNRIGRSMTVSSDRVRDLIPRDEVTVLHDVKRPGRSVVYELADFEVVGAR